MSLPVHVLSDLTDGSVHGLDQSTPALQLPRLVRFIAGKRLAFQILLAKLRQPHTARCRSACPLPGAVAGDQVEAQGVRRRTCRRLGGRCRCLGALRTSSLPLSSRTRPWMNTVWKGGFLSGLLAGGGKIIRGYPERWCRSPLTQHVSGVEVVQVLRLFRPARGWRRPQCGGGEPGQSQHVQIWWIFPLAALLWQSGSSRVTVMCPDHHRHQTGIW